ncbi:MAG: 50S ribosomal protein L30 [Desulfurococcaceae archaeon]
MSSDLYAIIRLRGRVNVPHDVEYTLKLLRLHKKFHLVIYPRNTPGIEGMLQKVKDWVCWGEISCETLVELLRRRGRLVGGRKLDDEVAAIVLKNYGLEGGVLELAKAICEGKIILHKDKLLKPVFRLAPPRGGFKGSIKKPFGNNGETGYRGREIDSLIRKMI